jgi:hypothetical protein
MGHSYLGFDGRREAAAWSCDGELSFFKLGGDGGLLRWASIQGEGWGQHQEASTVLLDSMVGLDWWQSDLALVATCNRGGGLISC